MKHIHRFFVTDVLATGQEARFDDDDAFHAARVLRLRAGDRVELAGVDGRVFEAEVTRVDGSLAARAGDEILGGVEAGAKLTVAQAIPKGMKMDLVVEKLSELGVSRLVPVYTEKSVPRPRDDAEVRLDRWRRLARAAAGQARRRRVMAIGWPEMLAVWLSGMDEGLIALATEAEGMPLGEAIDAAGSGPLTMLVGPEAGFSEAEIGMLRSHGALFAGLGELVLRTETAALVAAAIARHRLGELG